MKPALTFILTAWCLAGCAGVQLFRPTPTLTATITPTPTRVATATITLTPDLISEYLPLLPRIPSGFEWKIIPENELAVLIPDGWFFKAEPHPELNLDSFFVTRENIDETGRFSTGLTVFVNNGLKDQAEAEQFSQDLLTMHTKLATTREVLKRWDYKTDNYTVHHLRIRGEYTYETAANKNKIVQYSTFPANDAVYLIIFESPAAIWDQILNDYGILLDYVVVIKR